MDTHNSHPGDLSELEQRLAGCRPSAQGLDVDALLYAAGRASLQGVVRGRLLWACAACAMTAIALGLGVWLAAERAERHLLLARLRQQQTPVPPDPLPSPPPSSPPSDEGTPGTDYLTVRNLVLNKGVEAWREPDLGRGDPPRAPAAPPLRAWQREGLVD